VLGSTGLDAELEDDLADLQTVAVPRVHGLDDVRARLGDELGHTGELPRAVRQRDADGEVPAGGGEPVRDDALQQQRIDVASGQHRHRRP